MRFPKSEAMLGDRLFNDLGVCLFFVFARVEVSRTYSLICLFVRWTFGLTVGEDARRVRFD